MGGGAGGVRCSSVVRAHGAMGRPIDPSWGGGGGGSET